MLAKIGKKWDGMAVPYLNFKDLDKFAFEAFRQRATKKKRLDSELLDESDEGLIDRLNLKDGKYLKQAATLLFAKEPQRYITGSRIKIGF